MTSSSVKSDPQTSRKKRKVDSKPNAVSTLSLDTLVKKKKKGVKTVQLTILPDYLVPPVTPSYGLRKELNKSLISNAKKGIYLLWLDCLFNPSVKFESVLEELEPLLNQSKTSISSSNIIVLGSTQGSNVFPIGACVILLPKKLDNSMIVRLKIHIIGIEIDVAMKLLKECPLIFPEGFPKYFASINQVQLAKEFLRWQPESTPSPALALEPVLAQAKPAPVKPASSKPVPTKSAPTKSAPSQPAISKPTTTKPATSKSTTSSKVPSNPVQSQPEASKPASFKPLSKLKINRIAAQFNSTYNADDDLIETIIKRQEQKFKQEEIVGSTLEKMRSFGTSVLKIENLPSRLNFLQIKIMFGVSLEKNQIAACRKIDKKTSNPVMNLRLVLPHDSKDVAHFLSKNCYLTCDDMPLNIKKVDFKELETFLKMNATTLIEFKEENMYSNQAVPYAHETLV